MTVEVKTVLAGDGVFDARRMPHLYRPRDARKPAGIQGCRPDQSGRIA
ncbi:MAG: hypothetical protein OXC41_08065 [Gammaproteobacteria bacterium]|nr:hypothetical protein [Gammaproteobacteria bacterium]